MGEPRRLSDTNVGVAIHARVAPGPDVGDAHVDRAMIPAAERRAAAKDVALVVATRWIRDVAAGDGPDREGMYNGFQIALPGRLTRTRAADAPMEQGLAADRAERGRRTVALQAASLLRQAIPGSTVRRAMLHTSRSARLEVVPANRRETPGVVADEPQLGWTLAGV